jgi:hypothetical protein
MVGQRKGKACMECDKEDIAIDLLCLYFHLQKEEICGLNPQIRPFPRRLEEEFCRLAQAFLESYPEKGPTENVNQWSSREEAKLIWNVTKKTSLSTTFPPALQV